MPGTQKTRPRQQTIIAAASSLVCAAAAGAPQRVCEKKRKTTPTPGGFHEASIFPWSGGQTGSQDKAQSGCGFFWTLLAIKLGVCQSRSKIRNPYVLEP